LFNKYNQKLNKMKKMNFYALTFLGASLLFSSSNFAQTNVFDDVIAPSPNHTYLEAALIQEGLVGALQNPNATLTVFAPDDQAFTSLATSLGTTIPGLLALPNLDDILLYHVLGTTVPSSAVTNGAIVQPLSPTNTLKITATASGNVFINQAQVTTVDLSTANGVVHVTNGVLLPVETVADIAIDNGFSTLVAAVIQAELLPAVTNPLATLTVFAPTDEAFQDLADELGTTVPGLLSLPQLSDILLYHVLGSEVPSNAVTNGSLVQPLGNINTLKMTVTGTGDVYVNQAQVTAVDIQADVAIDNGFSTLVTAVVTAELLPALSDPFSEYTVFAPTNEAFTDLATALNTDLNGILALPNLADVLLYHVVGGTVLSNQLMAGPVATLEGSNVIVSLTGGVKINDANVTMADVAADNGVVHVLDKVILESYLGTDENNAFSFGLFPNPSNGLVTINGVNNAEVVVSDFSGKSFLNQMVNNNASLDLNGLSNGTYLVTVTQDGIQSVQTVVKF
jgi:uncharacterized surface protein with fasciclin (FAS1) repeats